MVFQKPARQPAVWNADWTYCTVSKVICPRARSKSLFCLEWRVTCSFNTNNLQNLTPCLKRLASQVQPWDALLENQRFSAGRLPPPSWRPVECAPVLVPCWGPLFSSEATEQAPPLAFPHCVSMSLLLNLSESQALQKCSENLRR